MGDAVEGVGDKAVVGVWHGIVVEGAGTGAGWVCREGGGDAFHF